MQNSEDCEFDKTAGIWIKYRVSKQGEQIITNIFNVPWDCFGYLEKYDHELNKCGAEEGVMMKIYRKNKDGAEYYIKQPFSVHLL